MPEARRQGIARALLTAAETHARLDGAKGLVLQTARDNLTAQALYASAGWRLDELFVTFERLF